MVHAYPFRGLRVRADRAVQVASVPYDVIDTAAAKLQVRRNPMSFLQVTRPESNLYLEEPANVSTCEAASLGALRDFLQSETLIQDQTPRYYLYRLQEGDHVQTGVVFCASVADYLAGIVRKHEYTRPDKEQDRVDHMLNLGVQTGLVLLAHPDDRDLASVVDVVTHTVPQVDFVASDGVRHVLWDVCDQAQIAIIAGAYGAMEAVFIADGHHRSAAAARVLIERRFPSTEPAVRDGFIAVSFPASELRILPYHRVVREMPFEVDVLWRALSSIGVLSDGINLDWDHPSVAVYAQGSWQTLCFADRLIPKDRLRALDVSLVQDLILQPLWQVEDPRTDPRMAFVGGDVTPKVLEEATGAQGVAFLMRPTSIEDVMAIANAGHVMPPKSTWFSPKLRDGLLCHVFDSERMGVVPVASCA